MHNRIHDRGRPCSLSLSLFSFGSLSWFSYSYQVYACMYTYVKSNQHSERFAVLTSTTFLVPPVTILEKEQLRIGLIGSIQPKFLRPELPYRREGQTKRDIRPLRSCFFP